jgi:eukaryotic-like serine/threonine-protein kinase
LLPLEVVRLAVTGRLATALLRYRATYMSPQQIRGEVVDERTDVYSLGVLAFQLLVGVPPFGEKSLLAVIDAITSATEVPAELFRGSSLRVAPVVLGAMAKDPDARSGSIREFMDRFRAATDCDGGRV